MAKRTTAQRRKAAKDAWARRRAEAAAHPINQMVKAAASAELFPHVPGYDALLRELSAAYLQSSQGKGKVRHANGRPFDRQPIFEIGRMNGLGFTTGQAAKKAQEALGMLARGERDAALTEIHGAIVYLAATAALIREG